MQIPAIANWNYSDLATYLADPNVVENDFLEFKVKINFSKAEEIRKDFSAFANSRGGYFFVGVDDHKNIAGIALNANPLADLNRVLSSPALSPKIKFEQINCLRIPTRTPPKFVYIFYVFPSLNHTKPHVSHEKVYFREQGEIKAVAGGERMRELFLASTFQPENIDQLGQVLERIKLYQYGHNPLGHFEVLYFRYVDMFLEDNLELCRKRGRPIDRPEELVGLFKGISTSFDELIKHQAQIHSSSGSPTLAISDSIRQKSDLLAAKVEEFFTKFKGHFLGI